MSLARLSNQFYETEESKKRKVTRDTRQDGFFGLGYYWENLPNMIAGINGGGALSTTTGVTFGTPSEEILAKVGGGVKQADMFAGETPATTSGLQQGGTAAGQEIMIAALLPVIARVGASVGARAAVGMGARAGGLGESIGASLGQRAAVNAATNLSQQFRDSRNNYN